jgi:hypothetical protein
MQVNVLVTNLNMISFFRFELLTDDFQRCNAVGLQKKKKCRHLSQVFGFAIMDLRSVSDPYV